MDECMYFSTMNPDVAGRRASCFALLFYLVHTDISYSWRQYPMVSNIKSHQVGQLACQNALIAFHEPSKSNAIT